MRTIVVFFRHFSDMQKTKVTILNSCPLLWAIVFFCCLIEWKRELAALRLLDLLRLLFKEARTLPLLTDWSLRLVLQLAWQLLWKPQRLSARQIGVSAHFFFFFSFFLSFFRLVNTKWSVVRKGNEPYPQSNKFVWQVVDRRRLLLVGTHHAVFEIVLAEPTVNSDTNAFFPVRLKCEIGGSGLELLSKPFFVLHPEAIDNLTKFSLDALDKWFLNPDMGLISVIEISTVRSKSLAAAFLRKHSGVKEMDSKRSTRSTNSLAQEASPGSPAATATTAAADDRAAPFGVRAKFLGGDNAILFLIEKVYPVPVPIDDVSLLVAVSQIFHFTHESIHWVGDRATTDILFSNAVLAAGPQVAQDKLHVYGVVVPCKGERNLKWRFG
jgi:hypothetical protein